MLQDYQERRPFAFIQQQGERRLFFWEKVIGGFIQDEFRVKSNLQLTVGARYDWQNYFHDNNNVAPRLSFATPPARAETG
jgi:outer membrane receptor protein involved in Fe transport